MQTFVNPIPSGGAPINTEELDLVFGEIIDHVQAILSKFTSDTQGVIVRGCVISGGGPYNMTEGIVFIDGYFLYVPAQTGITLPKYIYRPAFTYSTRVFDDSNTKNLIEIRNAALQNTAPGAGQYIAITTTTDPDDRRLSKLWPAAPFVTADIADDAITAAKIAAGQVGSSELASDAVTTVKILNANVTATKLATGAAVSNIGYTPALAGKPAWTNLTLINGWADDGVQPPRYRITDQGDLEIAAYLSSASASNAVFANLPNGTVTASRDMQVACYNLTDGTVARCAISGGSPTTLQIVGYAASKSYAVFITIPLDSAS